MKQLSEFVKQRRKEARLTQEEFAARTGVALTVVRKIEQGNTNLNLEKVNHSVTNLEICKLKDTNTILKNFNYYFSALVSQGV